tara:strand:+ start:774 stop:1214 length:441 start_codon:yes stop_codon:yes gene_type:complete
LIVTVGVSQASNRYRFSNKPMTEGGFMSLIIESPNKEKQGISDLEKLLGFNAMFGGYQEITKDNYHEVYLRNKILIETKMAFMFLGSEEKPEYPTLEMVKSCIGMKVNEIPKTRRQFRAEIKRLFIETAKNEARRVIQQYDKQIQP